MRPRVPSGRPALLGVLLVILVWTPMPRAAAHGGNREGRLSVSVTGFVGMAGGPGNPQADIPKKGPVRIVIWSVATNTVIVRKIEELPGEVVLRLRPGAYQVETTCHWNERTPATVKSGRPTTIPVSCGLNVK